MLSKLREKKRLWKRALFGSFAATSVMFTVCACYGMPREYVELEKVEGTVIDVETGDPVPGVQVLSRGLGIDAITDNAGCFVDSTDRIMDMWQPAHFAVRDIDGVENGVYEDTDTSIHAADLLSPLHLQVKPKHNDR